MASDMFVLKIVLCTVFVHLASSSSCSNTTNTFGKRFFFGIPGTVSSDSYITISTASNNTAHVTMSAPGIGYLWDGVVTTRTVILLSGTHKIHQRDGIDKKGFEIVSDEDVIIQYCSNFMHGSGYEGLLILPVNSLLTRYIVASYQPTHLYKNSVFIVGVTNNTEIKVQYKAENASYLTQQARLQMFETFQILSSFDISGAVVTSNKPVAVFGSSELSNIPVGEGLPNFLFEQMIPTIFWTNEYIVPSIYPHNCYIVRIISDHENTIVLYYNSTRYNSEYMSQGSIIEIMFGSEPVVIVSNKPISVIQYLVDDKNMYGNPYMLTSQGLSQFSHRYTFSTLPYESAGRYTLGITILKTMSNGLNLNGQEIMSLNTASVPVPFPFHDYVTIFFNMTYSTYIILEHYSGVKFGAILYAVLNDYSGYGSDLQFVLSECLTNLSHSVPSYSTDIYTSFLTTETTKGTFISAGNKTWCFQCDDMTHLQYCDSVTECKGNDEVCFVEKYKKHGSVQLYKSGCMEKSMCHSVGVNIECQQCCDGMFCNIEGCGDEDLPALGNRGPFCFACGHHGENDVCTTVQMCAPGQVCQTEMYVWGSGHHYVKGCVDQQICSPEFSCAGRKKTCLRLISDPHPRAYPVAARISVTPTVPLNMELLLLVDVCMG